MSIWKCQVCGYETTADTQPSQCSQCHANNFVKLEGEDGQSKYVDKNGVRTLASALISSTKTINGQSIWGSGNISAGTPSYNLYTVITKRTYYYQDMSMLTPEVPYHMVDTPEQIMIQLANQNNTDISNIINTLLGGAHATVSKIETNQNLANMVDPRADAVKIKPSVSEQDLGEHNLLYDVHAIPLDERSIYPGEEDDPMAGTFGSIYNHFELIMRNLTPELYKAQTNHYLVSKFDWIEELHFDCYWGTSPGGAKVFKVHSIGLIEIPGMCDAQTSPASKL